MSTPQPGIISLPAESATSSDDASLKSKEGTDSKHSKNLTPPTAPVLTTQETQRMEAALGDAILRFLRIRKGSKGGEYDLDGVTYL